MNVKFYDPKVIQEAYEFAMANNIEFPIIASSKRLWHLELCLCLISRIRRVILYMASDKLIEKEVYSFPKTEDVNPKQIDKSLRSHVVLLNRYLAVFKIHYPEVFQCQEKKDRLYLFLFMK